MGVFEQRGILRCGALLRVKAIGIVADAGPHR